VVLQLLHLRNNVQLEDQAITRNSENKDLECRYGIRN